MPPKVSSSGQKPLQTAASERPRRGTAAKDPPAAASKTKASTGTKTAATEPAVNTNAATTATGQKRGRATKDPGDAKPTVKRGRGAKAKSEATLAPAVPLEEDAPPKKRGRPPKGGETTKAAEDDPAAAEQLEEELVDAAAEPSKPSTKGKRATKKEKAAKAVKDKGEDDASLEPSGASGKQFWLMKAEQVDREETLEDGTVFSTKFTIDDLRSKDGPEPWDGVRNPIACKNLMAMKQGDLAFFYASGSQGKKLVPGIVGTMEVVKEHEPDMTAFDEKSPYFVKNPRQRGTPENPKWYMVQVEFRKKLTSPVTLKELQQFKGAGSILAGLQEFHVPRLSVSKVTQQEWDFIVDDLIEGYEENGSLATLPRPSEPERTSAAKDEGISLPPETKQSVKGGKKKRNKADAEVPSPTATKKDAAVDPKSKADGTSNEIPKTGEPHSDMEPTAVLDAALAPSETVIPTSETADPLLSTADHGKPVASRAVSAAAPPSRLRSRTPLARAASAQPKTGGTAKSNLGYVEE